jgi:hypothetical protein
MLISRFMLNLRHEMLLPEAQSTAGVSSMRFNNRILGNMGQSLRFGPDDDDMDNDHHPDWEIVDNLNRPREIPMERFTTE